MPEYRIDIETQAIVRAENVAQALSIARQKIRVGGACTGRRKTENERDYNRFSIEIEKPRIRVNWFATRALRYIKANSVAQLARRLGVTRPTVYAWLKGHPSPKILSAMEKEDI